MPYIAKVMIDAGEHIVYDTGQEVPEEIVDEGMIEAGSVEPVTKKQLAALADADVSRKSNKELREMCDELGLEATPRMNKDELIAMIEAGSVEPGDEGEGGE